ncbi:hypothetical protein M2650_02490 [Luteimonas sp. SX5]|uniref:Tripartite tricarboxylate transporter TctB family protein n=1 Tax=Luteimonas galliterrae TaxID=2940486 RepID=A0ABT0MF58_9GAMM|nr:hypothetical protein [Luteimonas galliterrae]MCL1633515.1 hypothetical protein [Luteimonas galliterrae]
MREVSISKRSSIIVGVALAAVSAYLIQFVLLRDPWVLPGAYPIGLGALILAYTATFYAKVEFEGLGILPTRPAFAIAFWLSVFLILLLFVFRERLGAPALEREVSWSHLVVGLLLYFFSAAAILGSFFSGFGFSVFLQNPLLWLRYLAMRSSGQLKKED